MSTAKKLKNSFFLLLAAAIWGFAFAFQSIGGKVMGPFTMNMCRSFIGAVVLIPVVKALYGTLKPDRDTLICGLICGVILTAACNLQQMALMYSTPGKTGFITASYMILVAIFGLLTGKKTGLTVIFSVMLGVLGLFLICIPEGENFELNKGELLAMGCSVAYASQIVVLDHYGERIRPVQMTQIQFFAVGILTSFLAFPLEHPTTAVLKDGLIPLLYVGVMSTAGAYSLQVIGMQGLNPAVASLIMSLESVFSVVGEYVIFGTMLTGKALAGCGIMFAAILLSQSELFRDQLRKSDSQRQSSERNPRP